MLAVFAAINARYVHSSYAALVLRAYLLENKCHVDTEIHEFTLGDRLENVLRKLFDINADIYMFPVYIFNINRVEEVSAALKAMRPESRIIWGGPEVSYDAAGLLQANHCVDGIICGEGESCLKLHPLHGTSFQKSIISSPTVLPFEQIPFPYKYVDMADYKNRIIYYETSRGCPFRCGYCMSSLEPAVRYKPLDRVREELAFFAEHKVPLVKLIDRTFNADPARARDIFNYLIDLSPESTFHFEIAGHLLDDATLELLHDAPKGLLQFEIGVQTTNPKSLSAITRKTDMPALMKAVGVLTARRRVAVHLDLIAGLPYDTLSDCAASINACMSLMPQALHLGFLKLLKGCALREQAEQHGFLYSQHPPYEVRATNHLSASDMQLLKRVSEALDYFYNSENYQASMQYIMQNMQNAFEFFNYIAERMEDWPSSMDKPLLLLYEAAKQHGLPDAATLWSCLRYDYLLLNKRANVPAFLRPDPVEKRTGKAHAERFAIDIPELLRTGNVVEEQVELCFDYAKPRDSRVSKL